MTLRIPAVVVAIVVMGTSAGAQRPSDPALVVPQQAPELAYVAAREAVTLPAGVTMGVPAAVAFGADGHLFVLTRGPQAMFEFTESGQFVRSFGDQLFTRAHGLRIDRDGNFWTTDVGAHVVLKLSPQGKLLLTLGTKGEAGVWNEAASSHKLNEPTDVLVTAAGDIFVSQGHTPGVEGDPRVLKFDKTGRLTASWGGKGKGPGQFDVAHGLALDAQGLLWVTDRENQRIQVFDQNGRFVRQVKYAGLPCALDIGRQFIYMVNGYAGQILQTTLDGTVLAATGRAGQGVGEFGEAHDVAVSPRGDILVADTVNSALQRFVKK